MNQPDYVLIIHDSILDTNLPNLEVEGYRGTKDALNAIFDAAVEDLEYPRTIILARIVREAAPIIKTTIYDDDELAESDNELVRVEGTGNGPSGDIGVKEIS